MQALLVDDHALFREGMKLLLRNLCPGVVVHQAATISEATTVLSKRMDIDLVLLDLQLPGYKRLDALCAMRDFDDEVPIVVLSGTEDRDVVEAAIELGAMGFIQKSVNPDQMLDAVQTVLSGKVYLPESSLSFTTSRPAPVESENLLTSLGISGRRAEVLRHLAQGKSTKVIARAMDISDTTVKTHIQALYDALNVHSRTQAVYELARHGWRLSDAL